MADPSLFRHAAVAAHRDQGLGRITLASPPSLRLLSALACTVVAAVIALLVGGSYARHTTLLGELVPDRGLIAVVSPGRGVIVERYVAEGDRVAAGQVLYAISAEQFSDGANGNHQRLAEMLARQRASLSGQLEDLGRMQRVERDALLSRRDGLRKDLLAIRALLDAQGEIVSLATAASERAQTLQSGRFVAIDELDRRRAAAVEQRARLVSLEREHGQLVREIDAIERELKMLPLRFQRDSSELTRALLANDFDQIENDTRRRALVVAPAGGIVAALTSEIGQPADAGVPLATLVPDGATLQAHLAASREAIGSISPGAQVQLRYPAFPYQTFGHYGGRVAGISLSTLPGPGMTDGYYRVVVELEAQQVSAHGRTHALQPGMSVAADVIQERRRLIAWIVDPLRVLAGRWH